jgi:hypothetical protein
MYERVVEIKFCSPEFLVMERLFDYVSEGAGSVDCVPCRIDEMLVGNVGTCSVGGANFAPVNPSSVIRANARLTSSRKYQTNQIRAAGQITIRNTSMKAFSLSSGVITQSPKNRRRSPTKFDYIP